MENKEKFIKYDLFVISILLICLAVGLFVFNDYGASWDENIMQVYADQSLNNYSEWRNNGEIKLEHETLQYYGPFFMMTVQVASRFMDRFLQTNIADVRHLVYFVFYFSSIIAFYSIARRWFDPLSSIGATLLYAFQPVLWGHAFINPKDTPFMSLMVLSIATGLKMVDATRVFSDSSLNSIKPRIWTMSLVWLASVLLLFLFTSPIHNLISSLVISAKAGETNIITLVASKLNQVPAKIYIERYFVLFLQARAIYIAVTFVAMLYVWYRSQTILLKMLGVIFFPAVILGFTTSTRVLGPFAGVIIACFFLRNRSRISFVACVMYVVVAIAVAYITWPFLWSNPAVNFFASIQKMSAFPWAGDVLFNGNLYKAPNIPFVYLPTLLLIQMTEPVWILALFGVIFSFLQRKIDLIVLFTLWFLIPFLGLFLGNATLFDNFRHVLFILPSIFLLSGAVFEKVPKTSWRVILIAACILPGIFGIISLHPYEYAYYNQFVGGLKGAQGRFETEYWLTSYREASEYINKHASPEAGIWVDGPGHVFSPYAREDLKINSWSSENPVDHYEYVVASYRFISNKTAYPDAEVVYKIIRDDVVLAVIRKP